MAISAVDYIGDIVRFIRNDLRTNITDPLSRGSGFVMTAYPKRKIQYPIITIKTVGSTTQKLGMQSEAHIVTIPIEVRIWARNSKESDSLTAQVIDRLRSIQYGTGGTDAEEIFGFKLASVVPVVEEIGPDNLIHSKVCQFEYKAILT